MLLLVIHVTATFSLSFSVHLERDESPVGDWGLPEMEGLPGFVWHVNSNQSSDIHQASWPTVRIDLAREDVQPRSFVSSSICSSLPLSQTPPFYVSACFGFFSSLF